MMIPEPWQNHETMDRRARGVLRVPLVADGAVGRPGVDRVHRRHGDRRGARSQRPASVALLRHQGRPRHHGVGSRRARHSRPRTSPSRSVCTRARSSSSTPRRAASSTTRRSSASWRRQHPYGEWLEEHLHRHRRPARRARAARSRITTTVLQRQQAFGYTHEDLRVLLAPMATQRRGGARLDGHRHVAGGAVEQSAAALRLLQAAVRAGHQPAARRDPRGAGHVDGLDDRPRGQPARPAARVVPPDRDQVPGHQQRATSRSCATSTADGCKTTTLPMLYDPAEDGPGLERAMDELCRDASDAVADGCTILILSDRGVDATQAPIPSLLATAGVHHHLVREGTRTRCALVVESGDAREVHHCALLHRLRRRRGEPVSGVRDARRHDPRRASCRASRTRRRSSNYIKALNKGILKVMSKMGISTLASYCGAQIFEAIGLSQAFVDRYFTVDAVAHRRRRHRGRSSEEVRRRHEKAFPQAARRPGRSRLGRRVPVAPRRRVPPVQPGDRLQAAARDAQRAVRDLQGIHDAGRPADAQARDAARPVRLQAGRDARSRSTRSSRSSRSSSASRPARCRSARSAPRRTRRSPSR